MKGMKCAIFLVLAAALLVDCFPSKYDAL